MKAQPECISINRGRYGSSRYDYAQFRWRRHHQRHASSLPSGHRRSARSGHRPRGGLPRLRRPGLLGRRRVPARRWCLLLRPADPQRPEPDRSDADPVGRPPAPASVSRTARRRHGHPGRGLRRLCAGPLGADRGGRRSVPDLPAEPPPRRPGAGLCGGGTRRQPLPAHLVDVGAAADLPGQPARHRGAGVVAEEAAGAVPGPVAALAARSRDGRELRLRGASARH